MKLGGSNEKEIEKGEVLDVYGNVIPHLYSARELGYIFSSTYQVIGNLGECVAFGRILGDNAAKVKNDVSVKPVMEGKTPTAVTWKAPDEIILKSGEFIGVDKGI